MPQGTAVTFSGVGNPPLDAADKAVWHYRHESDLNWRVWGQPELPCPANLQANPLTNVVEWQYTPLVTVVNAPNSVAFYADTPSADASQATQMVLPIQIDWQVLSGPGGGCRFDPKPVSAGVTILGTPENWNRQGWICRISGDAGCDYVFMARVRPVAPNTASVLYTFRMNMVVRCNSLALSAPGPNTALGNFAG
jgi:hypothetical protein